MSRPSGGKGREATITQEFVDITGATTRAAAVFVKKYKTLDAALDAFYNDYAAQASTAASSANTKGQEKKLGDIWESLKDPSEPKLIKMDGTMEMCERLDINPESDSVLFCLAADLGSKVTGEWEKIPFVQGWMAMPGNIDSWEGMKAHLPTLRRKLVSDPAYFKKVYTHVFDLIKNLGAKVIGVDVAIDMWNIFIPPAMESRPSALSYQNEANPSLNSSVPKFTKGHFQQWLDFQRKRNKAVNKDTWVLLVDFIRSIDADFKEFDESGAWPSAIDEFVDHVRSQKK